MVDFIVSSHGCVRRDAKAFLQNRVERFVFNVTQPRREVQGLRSVGSDVEGLNGEGRIGGLFHRDLGRLSQR